MDLSVKGHPGNPLFQSPISFREKRKKKMDRGKKEREN
jgi:hypothetical protein